MLAILPWLVQPAFGQADSKAIPEELRIIEDLPEAVEEGRRVLGRGSTAPGEEDIFTNRRAEEGRTVAQGG